MNKSKADLTKSWRVLEGIISQKKENSMFNRFMCGNYQEVTDAFQIANMFNNYFINICPSLDKKIPKHDVSPLPYMPDRMVESLFFQPVCAKEVLLLSKQLQNSSPDPRFSLAIFDKENNSSLYRPFCTRSELICEVWPSTSSAKTIQCYTFI